MAHEKVVLLIGDFSDEQVNIERTANEFSWTVLSASNPLEAARIDGIDSTRAVLVKTDGAVHSLRSLLADVGRLAPQAHLIPCLRANEWVTELNDSEDRFLPLLSPLRHSELRQALGFVWVAGRVVDPKRPFLMRAFTASAA